MGLLDSKRCGLCATVKPLNSFRLRSDRSNGLRQSYCKDCENAYRREWRVKNPEKERQYERKHRFRRDFGGAIDPAEYDRRLAQQGGTCAICDRQCPSGYSLAVDHDHQTGEIRGLLCGSCNRALGLLGEDVDRLAAAVEYLRGARVV